MATSNVRGFRVLPVVAAAACLVGGIARAELPAAEVAALSRAYGVGVHAYFANDHQRAYDDLTQAIEAGTRDPRAWYFRGLAALKLGRLDEAEADFSTAADMEAEAAADWDVSRSLERVQGPDRLQLERHRVRARVTAYQQRAIAAQRRYLGTQGRQPDVLRTIRPEGRAADPLGMFTGDEAAESAPVETVPAPAEDTPAEDTPAEDTPADEPAAEEPAPEAPPAEAPMAEELEAEREDAPAADAPGADVFGN